MRSFGYWIPVWTAITLIGYPALAQQADAQDLDLSDDVVVTDTNLQIESDTPPVVAYEDESVLPAPITSLPSDVSRNSGVMEISNPRTQPVELRSQADRTRAQREALERRTENAIVRKLEEDRMREELIRANKFLKATNQAATQDSLSESGEAFEEQLTPQPAQRAKARVEPSQEGLDTPAQPAPQTIVQPIIIQTPEPAAPAATNVSTASTSSKIGQVKANVGAGYVGVTNDYFEIDTTYSWGIGLGYDLDTNIELGISYNYNLFDLSPKYLTYSGFNPRTTDYTLEQHNIGVDARFHLLGTTAKFRPFLGGGVNYVRSLVEFDDTYWNRYNYRETNLNSFGASGIGGVEVQLSKSLLIGGQAKYTTILSSDSSTSDSNPYYVWGGNRNVDARREETLGENNFYQVMGYVGFSF